MARELTTGANEQNPNIMSTEFARPTKVAIIGASGAYGTGILARAEELGIEAVVVTRSPHKFKDVKPTTTVVETQLDDEQKLKEAFTGCDGVISALGDDRKKRPKTHNLPHVWTSMKAAGVTKYIGMGPGPMMMPGEKPGRFQRTIHPLLNVLKFFGVDFLEQNEWERDSLSHRRQRRRRPHLGPHPTRKAHQNPLRRSLRPQERARPNRLLHLRPRRLLPLLRGLERLEQTRPTRQLRPAAQEEVAAPSVLYPLNPRAPRAS